MGIFRTDDPTQYNQVDGIVISEKAPAPKVVGVAANVAILVGTSQRGPQELLELVSNQMLKEKFGNDSSKGLYKVLKNKGFGRLKFVRVVAADSAKATRTFIKDADPDVNVITFEALHKGAYGNNIKVKIEAGSSSGKKYTVSDTNPDAVLPEEVYDNLAIGAITADTFAKSKLVKVTVVATTDEPDNIAATSLAGGSDGTVGDTDYQTAIAVAAQEGAGNVLFLDSYNSTRNGYLKAHAASANDKMVITQSAVGDDASETITDVANLRDTAGRIIHAFDWAYTNVDSVEVLQPLAWWIASVISQTSPHIDPADVDNAGMFYGILRMQQPQSRASFILLNKAGVCAAEYDPDFGHKIKSGVVTQILNSEKTTILRRRMTDFLTDSAAKYLKNYQNKPNSLQNRKMAAAGLSSFDSRLEKDGMLPSDAEMTDGAKAKIIDITTVNDNDSIAAGEFRILYRRRIYSSMRYIVLLAEIGQSVKVTESEV